MPISDWGYPEFPDELGYLWQHFVALNNTRQAGMSINPITYIEIDAYCRLTQTHLSLFDVTAIKRLDIVAMNVINEPVKDKKG